MHFVGVDEADEMIQPTDIEPSKSCSQALDPPAVVLLLERLPPIHRDTPNLSRFGEIIGRNSRDHRGVSVGIQFEKIGMCPYIGALMRHEQGNITDQADLFGGAVSS